MSPERLAAIEAFKKQSDGLEKKFEARSYKSDWTMPYRLFRPATENRVPLVLYLHGSGGLGDDNLKQLGLGNVFGTRIWLLPENQEHHPCFVLVPQTDRGWARYDLSQPSAGPAKMISGLGDGARVALEMHHAFAWPGDNDPAKQDKLRDLVNQRLDNVNELVLFDPSDRTEIEFPRGWQPLQMAAVAPK